MTGKLIASNLVSMCFVAGAVFLSYNQRPGWGWCIVGAVICFHSITSKQGTPDA